MHKAIKNNIGISAAHRDAARPEAKPFVVFTSKRLKGIVKRAGLAGGSTRKVMKFVKGLFS